MPNAQINGFNMHYVEAGKADGETLVTTTGWGPMASGLLDRSHLALPERILERYRVIAYDHRGIGKSAGGLDREASTRLYAQDTVALMDHLKIDRAHVFGIGGMGGCTAQWIGIDAPERVHSLILGHGWMKCDPFLRIQFETMFDLRERDFFKYQAITAVLCNRVAYFNEHHDELLGPKGGWSSLIDKPKAHLNFIRACLEHDTTEFVGRITAPTLIINGSEYDLITGARLGEELHRHIKGSKLVILEGAPHSTRSVPAAFRQYEEAIVAFIGEHARTKVPT